MKDLDQPSRASLRKYGVRFGAYHIYLPALLKPAARALASLLWAQKQDNVDCRRCRARSIWRAAAAPRSRSTSCSPATPIACWAIGNAASARCGSISWSGSPI